MDPTAALRTLDQGPPADQADAARAFRAFWGAKAELRRFQDGAITEAVVWEEGGPAGRHLILDRWGGGLGGWAGAPGRGELDAHHSLFEAQQAWRTPRGVAARPADDHIPPLHLRIPCALPPRSIVSYILQRHLPTGCTVACHAGALDAALRRRHSSLDADALAARLCEGAAERLG